jgi:hypothetical protein
MRIENLPSWERVVRSGLLEPAQVLIVRAEVASWKDPAYKSLGTAAPDPTALQAAEDRLREWLIGHDLLTTYQAQVVMAGLRGPLDLARLRLVGQLSDWGLPHHYWAASIGLAAADEPGPGGPGSPSAILAFAQGATSADWTAIRQRVARLMAAAPELAVPQLLRPWAAIEDPPHCAILWPPCLTATAAAETTADERPAGTAAEHFQSLAHRLRPEGVQRVGGPSTKRILQWTADIAAALEALHHQQLTLGALNPAAVGIVDHKRAAVWALPVSLLKTAGFAAAVYGGPSAQGPTGPLPDGLLEDFGSARDWGWRPIDFLSPEQLPGKTGEAWGPVTPAGDLYALGRLLHWMLGGAPAPQAPNWAAARNAKLKAGIGQLPGSVPSPLGKLVGALLQPDPQQRPKSAAEVGQSLKSLLKQAAEPARPLFFLGTASRELQRLSRQWPNHCWTPAVDQVQPEELPALVKAAALPKIVSGTGEPPATEGLETGVGISHKPFAPVRIQDANGAASIRTLRQQRSRNRSRWSAPLISCLVSGSAVLAVLIWWMAAGPTGTPRADRRLAPNDGAETKDTQVPVDPVVVKPTGWHQQIVPDDGRLLWESPTVGLPVDVSHLPNSPTGLVVIQGEFWNSPACQHLLRVWEGPDGNGQTAAFDQWRQMFSVDRFTRMLAAQYQALDGVQHAFVLEADEPVAISLAGWKLSGALSLPSPSPPLPSLPLPGESVDGANGRSPLAEEASPSGPLAAVVATPGPVFHFLLVQQEKNAPAIWAQLAAIPDPWTGELPTIAAERLTVDVFDPTQAEVSLGDTQLLVRRLVVANPEMVRSVIQNQGETLVSGTMARLLASSDRDRHVQLFVNPVTIWNAQGQDWLGLRWAWLGQLIKDRVPTSVRMLGLSAHMVEGGETYLEAKFVADRAPTEGSAAGPIMRDLSEMPQAVKRSLLDLPRVAYWENALLRYDNMLQDISSLVRAGEHDRLPTLNAWLRPRALDNLVATTELYFMAVRLSQGEAVGLAGGSGVRPASPPAVGPQSLAALLQRPRSLNIPEQDLINALAELETEIKSAYPDLPFEFSIELDGNALRLEGITQNQKVSNFRLENQPLADILTALVLKANPDPAVTTARDPKCKLIWLIDPARPLGQIRVSTRAAAQENGWVLPPEVTPE